MPHKDKKDEEQEFEQAYLEFQIIQQQMLQIQEQIKIFENQERELIIALNAINQLQKIENNTKALIPVVNGIFIEGEIKKPENFIINVGGNIAVKKNKEEAEEIINQNIMEIQKYKEKLVLEFNKLNSKLEKIAEKIKDFNTSD
ncbi:MAG: prefoldin subunit alpha [Candidatus Woesearchaeota archaeon]